MPYNLLLFPLIAGYLFIHVFYYTRYRAFGLSGYRLLFESALVGLVLAVPSHALVLLIGTSSPSFRAAWKAIAPFEHSGKAAAVISVGFVVPLLFNALASAGFGRQRIAAAVLRRFGDPLTRLFLSATLRAQPVLITMDNRKLYAGFVVLSLGLNPQTRHIRLLPLMSGYRDESTGEAFFTTEYAHIYDLIELGEEPELNRFTASDFQVVLPLEEIESARLFDPLVYAKYFRDEE